MVLSGVMRACGPDLHRFLGKALRNRYTAFGAGLGLTACGVLLCHTDRASSMWA
jgi:Na+/phosphate symporter